ncbi:MAG: HDIG domain-containing metalloprotein [Nitrospirota bacterium]
MGYKIQDSDIALLRKAGVSENDVRHCVKVAEKALEIAERTGSDVNMELIGRGALFHDLGKAKTHEIEHGKIGAELGSQLGLIREITDIMEKHIRGGLTEEEARELGLPVKDYTLKTLEERIVIYSDRLVDIIMDGIVDIGGDELEAERRFEEILMEYPKYGKNKKTLNRYLEYHREMQGLMSIKE